MTKLKAAGVQAILNWSIEPAQAIVIKNARQIGLKVPIFQSHGFGNVQYAKAAGAAAEGVIFPASRVLVAEALPASHPQKAVLVRLQEGLRGHATRRTSSTFGGHAYDALRLLAQGRRGGRRATARRPAPPSRARSGFVGTAGVFNFSPTDHNGLGHRRLRAAHGEGRRSSPCCRATA